MFSLVFCDIDRQRIPYFFFQAFDELKTNCAGNHDRTKIIARLLAADSLQIPHQSSPTPKIKCMVGKFIVGQQSEVKCKSIADKVADIALSDDFIQRTQTLKTCLLPQLFACNCRLMVNQLMSPLPQPESEEDAYGADHLANFNELLWTYVLVPLLMTDLNHCANVFVRLFTAQEYGNSAGHIDASEHRIMELENDSKPNLFFIKGQGSRGLDVDDHFLHVSPIRNTLCCR